MKDAYFYFTAVAAVLAVVLGAYVVLSLPAKSYQFSATTDGVEFVSDVMAPGRLLQEMRESRNWIVSPEFVQKGTQNSYMTSSLTLLSTVLAAKNKDFILVARIVDEKGALIECQSNFGDYKQNREISLAECNQFISDTTTPRIFVELPGEVPRPQVLVGQNVVYVKPSSFDNVARTTFVLLKSLYPDSGEIIANVNELVGNL